MVFVAFPYEVEAELTSLLEERFGIDCRGIPSLDPIVSDSLSSHDLVCLFDDNETTDGSIFSQSPSIVIGRAITPRRAPSLIRQGAASVYDLEHLPLVDLAPLIAAHVACAAQNVGPNPRRNQANGALVATASFALIEWDRDLTILRWSDEAESILGIPKNDAQGRALGKWLLPSRETVHFLSGCQSLATGILGNFKTNCRVMRSDGVSLDASWKVTPHWEHPDQFVAIFELTSLDETKAPNPIISIDTLLPSTLEAETNRPKSRAVDGASITQISTDEYKPRAEFLAAAVEQLSIGVYVREEKGDGVFTVWNAQMEQLFQLPRNTVIGRSVADVFADPLLRQILGEAKKPHSRSRAIVPSYSGGEAQTSFIADITKTPILDEQGEQIALISIVHDVTERIQSENRLVSAFNELEASKEKLEQSNLEIRKGIEKAKRLAIAAQASNRAKSFFLSNISHELRTPLTSIVSLTHALLEGTFGSINPKQKEYLEIVSDSSKHLQALITDILDLSKIELGKLTLNFARSTVAEIAQASIRMVMQQAQAKNLLCELSIRSAHDAIDVDPKRLRQMLLNLLFNAVKFTRPATTISLRIESKSNSESLVFSVADEGIGIRESDIEKIFTPFTQLDDSLSKQYEGTGLGLAVVSKLVELHGGSISVNSRENAGATFSITLPISQESDEPGERAQTLAKLAAQKQSGTLAIVVDESERVARQIQATVEQFGYRHTVIAMPNELSAYFDQVAPNLLIADLSTIVNHGAKWIRQARQHAAWSEVKWIATSSLDIPASRETAARFGFDDFLAKPITRFALETVT